MKVLKKIFKRNKTELAIEGHDVKAVVGNSSASLDRRRKRAERLRLAIAELKKKGESTKTLEKELAIHEAILQVEEE